MSSVEDSASASLGVHPGARQLPSQRRTVLTKSSERPYLPTLFDRLLDDEPSQKTEAPSAYAMTREQMRRIIQRDLSFLLGTTNAHDWLDAAQYPAAASSTLNYGMPAMAGGYLSAYKWADIERMIRTAVLDFEPRIIPESLRVQPLLKDGAHNHYNVLLFELSGLVSMQPYPLEFMVQSAVDLESNRITLKE
jgi:type VI secretion system protein ImpF